MGLDVYARWDGQTQEECQAQYTGFRTDGAVGYLRSAYNPDGWNQWCKAALGVDGFDYIFGFEESKQVQRPDPEDPTEEMSVFFPDWKASRARATALLTTAKAKYPNPSEDECYCIGVIGEILKFIDLGESKNAWTYWSG